VITMLSRKHFILFSPVVDQRLSNLALRHSQHESIRFGEDKPNVIREKEVKKPRIASGGDRMGVRFGRGERRLVGFCGWRWTG
jgi:hypothetical protein